MTTLTTSRSELSTRPDEREGRPALEITEAQIRARVDEILNRRPAVGFALGVVRDGGLAFFSGHGLADVAHEDAHHGGHRLPHRLRHQALHRDRRDAAVGAGTRRPRRAGKRLPARLSADPCSKPASGRRPLRHLLTHTAGIPDVRRISDLLHASLTPSGGRPPQLSVEFGEPLPSLADYYRGGLRVVVEPGSAFAYSNHGYATLGQIVEDVSGMPLERFFRERIFEPLGMADSDLVRSERIAARLATGYALGRRGARAVPDRDWIGAGAGGIYSTPRDMARFVAALLGGGAERARARARARDARHDVRAPLPAGRAAAGHGPRVLPRRRRRPPPRPPRRDPAGLQLGAPGGARRRDRRHRPDQRLGRRLRLAVGRARAIAPRAAWPAGGRPAERRPAPPRGLGASSVAGTSSRRASPTCASGSCWATGPRSSSAADG